MSGTEPSVTGIESSVRDSGAPAGSVPRLRAGHQDHYCYSSLARRQVRFSPASYGHSGPAHDYPVTIVTSAPPRFSATEWYLYSLDDINALSFAVLEPIRSLVRVGAWSPSDDLKAQFDRLVDRWLKDTMISSSSTDMCMHEAYQQIIGLGERVVPLILEEMLGGYLHWGWALAAITRQDPASNAKSPKEATEAWLQWGRSQRLIIG